MSNLVSLASGQKIAYVKSGSGPHAVLVLPGALGSAASDFPPQFDPDHGLAKVSGDKLSLIGWDPPGYGKSTPPKRTWPLHFLKRDAEVAAEFMEKLGHHKYSLLGWSDGGITAMILAALFPDKVDKMVIWGANAFINEKDIGMTESVRDVSKWSDRMRAPMEMMYGAEYFPTLWGEWCDAYKRVYEENEGNLCCDLLKDIRCPSLIIHGNKDAMVDNIHPDHLKESIADSELHIYPEGKHNLHLKYKDDFNALVSNFILK